MEQDEVEVQIIIIIIKKRIRPISSHLDQTSLVNIGFIIWPKDYTKEFHFCQTKASNPKQARYLFASGRGK